MSEIETSNDTLVAARGGRVSVMNLGLLADMDRETALRHAAWIVAMFDRDDEFAAILQAVQET